MSMIYFFVILLLILQLVSGSQRNSYLIFNNRQMDVSWLFHFFVLQSFVYTTHKHKDIWFRHSTFNGITVSYAFIIMLRFTYIYYSCLLHMYECTRDRVMLLLCLFIFIPTTISPIFFVRFFFHFFLLFWILVFLLVIWFTSQTLSNIIFMIARDLQFFFLSSIRYC